MKWLLCKGAPRVFSLFGSCVLMAGAAFLAVPAAAQDTAAAEGPAGATGDHEGIVLTGISGTIHIYGSAVFFWVPGQVLTHSVVAAVGVQAAAIDTSLALLKIYVQSVSE